MPQCIAYTEQNVQLFCMIVILLLTVAVTLISACCMHCSFVVLYFVLYCHLSAANCPSLTIQGGYELVRSTRLVLSVKLVAGVERNNVKLLN